jgi:MtrB/PioB family decaheme-associated outer membrane protein
MNKAYRTLSQITSASVLVLAAAGALGQETEQATQAEGTYTPLQLANRPAQAAATDSRGTARIGAAYTGDDNYMFGQYNGLNEDEVTLIGDLQWQDFSSGESYWQASVSNLGLDTREGLVTWGRPDQLKVSVGFDSQKQVRNNTGRTPFRGETNQSLPDNWDSGVNTGDFSTLDASLRKFDREIERDKLTVALETRLADRWSLTSNLSYEEKEGDGDTGAGIYINGASADAVLLQSPVDYTTTEFDVGVAYAGDRLHLNGQLAYSDFDNDDDELIWQNPYSNYGPDVAWPDGEGGLGLAPDSEQFSGRMTGHYIFSSRTRFQFDGSYAITSQDQGYLDYTVNPALVVSEPLPQTDYDGEVATGTANARLLFEPLPKLRTELFYKLRDRDYDADREGYLYVRGDGADQPDSAQTVYNTNHDLTEQTSGVEFQYPLPLRSRLSFEYAYEDVERRNAAVENTEEDRYTLKYRIQPWSDFSARMQLRFADRTADDYQWDQSYYALLDAQLINATPDSQRYINHPELMQYYLANREQYEAKGDFTYLIGERWNLSLNTLWRYDDYDQSNLGLTESEWIRGHFNVSYVASATLSANVYAGYDRYDGNQTSRAFRGGQEKNAFEIYPPLPQASDPQQNWDLDAEDHSVTVGASLQWQPAADLDLVLDYSYVDTRAEQELHTRTGSSVTASDLPDVDTTLHHVEATGTWHMREHLSLQLEYQYYSYESDDWAWDNVQADTIDKVLTFGQDNPDEDIHYVGASVIYRWQ